ncbi:hypothetical protein TGDOM2_265480 [Toxoplasma gondii GAB2-2007-GAL-DOM2]|uniref:Uncharacterized protein n=5 Tax=Toxoplasma gondii TaxID=5811 RepID=S7VQG5_TOXGG|nr:hypothetical protein TGGT1_265480 [Toxoplasma gondii GT1]KAF4644207.1 hypothetical protein TGRH88_011990 [Toxoplasma gondii]KFG38583.1 hypothetical protein TGDOM2_265480 [Toxoplasma gondii GAB2-2007-GAL-DOM2]KFG42083.1 hypothetical protein TGFOU_265480 [Toxoplasma gondii FOU]RQX74027.1 hypothetical protein TGCAST_265480 [Toxoplasma gondii CAST]
MSRFSQKDVKASARRRESTGSKRSTFLGVFTPEKRRVFSSAASSSSSTLSWAPRRFAGDFAGLSMRRMRLFFFFLSTLGHRDAEVHLCESVFRRKRRVRVSKQAIAACGDTFSFGVGSALLSPSTGLVLVASLARCVFFSGLSASCRGTRLSSDVSRFPLEQEDRRRSLLPEISRGRTETSSCTEKELARRFLPLSRSLLKSTNADRRKWRRKGKQQVRRQEGAKLGRPAPAVSDLRQRPETPADTFCAQKLLLPS